MNQRSNSHSINTSLSVTLQLHELSYQAAQMRVMVTGAAVAAVVACLVAAWGTGRQPATPPTLSPPALAQPLPTLPLPQLPPPSPPLSPALPQLSPPPSPPPILPRWNMHIPKVVLDAIYALTTRVSFNITMAILQCVRESWWSRRCRRHRRRMRRTHTRCRRRHRMRRAHTITTSVQRGYNVPRALCPPIGWPETHNIYLARLPYGYDLEWPKP
jgi:hypothetical protein